MHINITHITTFYNFSKIESDSIPSLHSRFNNPTPPSDSNFPIIPILNKSVTIRAFTILTFAIAAIATPLQNRQSNPSINLTELYTCNGAPYAPLNYTCYDDQLCPVINGRTQGECRGACYDPALYGCTNNILVRVHAGTFSNGTTANTTAYLPLCTQARLPCPEDLAHPVARLPH